MRLFVCGVCAAVILTLAMTSAFQAGEEKPKYTIKQVMQKAHKGAKDSLLAKVAAGEASKEDMAKLVALYEALSMNEPPKGELEDWKVRTSKLVELAKKAEKGDADAAKMLTQAASCAACHKAHK